MKELPVQVYEAFVTKVKNSQVYFTLVNPTSEKMNGFAGEQHTYFKNLINQGIRLKPGSIFFVVRYKNDKGASSEQFRPWTNESVSKKLYDIIKRHQKEEIDGLYGWLADRLIEYEKFKDGDKIIEQINDAVDDFLQEKEEIKMIYQEYTQWNF